MHISKKAHSSILTTLLLSIAVILIVAGVYWIAPHETDIPRSTVVIMGTLFLCDAALFISAVVALFKKWRHADSAITALLVVNSLATITDDFGIYDALFLLLLLAALLLVYKKREITQK